MKSWRSDVTAAAGSIAVFVVLVGLHYSGFARLANLGGSYGNSPE